jgi:hypothetical protein
MAKKPMTREEIIASLRAAAPLLRARGVIVPS